MTERDTRLKAIREIITETRISSQEQLLHKLEEGGVRVTQATLSRDLRYLKAGKNPSADGGYDYVFLETNGETTAQNDIEDFKRGYISISFSGNIGVIKTLAGHADTVAIVLDRLKFPEVLGTLAGDDTILVILRKDEMKHSLLEKLTAIMGNIEVLG